MVPIHCSSIVGLSSLQLLEVRHLWNMFFLEIRIAHSHWQNFKIMDRRFHKGQPEATIKSNMWYWSLSVARHVGIQYLNVNGCNWMALDVPMQLYQFVCYSCFSHQDWRGYHALLRHRLLALVFWQDTFHTPSPLHRGIHQHGHWTIVPLSLRSCSHL